MSSFILFSCNKKQENRQSQKLSSSKYTPSDSASFKQLVFKQFGSKDGLLSTQVWNIYQDKFGYTWVATNEGLARFDGFKFYSYFDDLKKNIHLKMASSFFEDNEGTLWVLSGSGFLNKFNRNQDKFEYVKTPFENGWIEQSTHTILEDSLKNLWFGAYGGLQYFDRKKDSIACYPISKIREPSWQEEEKLRFGKIVKDKKGNFWIGTRKFGLVKFDIQTKKYYLYRYDKRFYFKFLSDWITDIIPLEDGTMLIAEWDVGIIHWDVENDKIIDILKVEDLLNLPTHVNIRDMFLEDKKYLWLGTDTDGLLVLNITTNKIIAHYKHDVTNKSSISGNTIRHISKDVNGNYWISANTLEMASPKFAEFKEYINKESDDKSIRNNIVYSLSSVNDKKLLVSTQMGLSIFNPTTQTFDNTYNFNKENPASFGVLAAKDNTIWLSYKDKTVHFEPQSKKVIHEYAATLTTDNNVNFLKRACKFLEDSRGIIWTVNHWGRLNYINPQTHEVGTISDLSQDFELKKFVNVLSIIDDPTHRRLIVCTDIGLATVAYQNYEVDKKKIVLEGIDMTKFVFSYIYKDASGNVWVVAEGLVYQLDTTRFTLKKLKISQNFSIENAKWIIEEPKGVYWISSYKGILKYEPNIQKSTIYFTPNVAGITLDSPSPVLQLADKIYFGGFYGLSMFEPKKFVESGTIPKINIESLTFSSDQQKGSIIDSTLLLFEQKEIHLNYFQNKIKIKYIGINPENPTATKYLYKLDGYDRNWVNAGNIQEVIYTNLSPKTYQFQVKASSPNNQWSEITSIKIVISPPFWLTWWALLCYLAAISTLIYYFIKFRVQSRLKKIKELEAIRVRISSNLHDDVGSILSGLAMQSQMLAFTAKGEEKDALLEISNMSQDAMERMRDTVWAIDSRKDKYENLIDRMRAYSEKNLNFKHIKHSFRVEAEDVKKFINPEKRQNIYLIFKEAITNICKHSDAKNVNILFRQEKNELLLIIHDDGLEKESINSDGLGLINMKMRAKNIGATLSINYENGFVVRLEL